MLSFSEVCFQVRVKLSRAIFPVIILVSWGYTSLQSKDESEDSSDESSEESDDEPPQKKIKVLIFLFVLHILMFFYS